MPSNFTQNYRLNQWSKSDKVLMADFNADNAKIDAALAGKGNCQIYSGTYEGNGTIGPDHPTTITFSCNPFLILIWDNTPLVAVRGTKVGYMGSTGLTLSWTENTLSWYHNSSSFHPSNQLNAAGQTYQYLMFVAM